MFTVGHGTASQDELIGRLRAAGIQSLVDVRTAPGSRKHPHVAREALERWLPDAGVAYRWEPRLGGFRRPAADSPDTAWRNESFRGYAGHLRTPEAHAAIADLLTEADQRTVTVMCSETLWWRCHRRLIADALVLLHDRPVRHIMPAAVADHRPTAGARVEGRDLIYDGAAG